MFKRRIDNSDLELKDRVDILEASLNSDQETDLRQFALSCAIEAEAAHTEAVEVAKQYLAFLKGE